MSACSNKKSDAEKIREDGVEVIINRNAPYIVEGHTKILNLKEDFIIDLEEDDLAALGLTDVWGFDVDSKRNIYFFKSPISEGDLVYKFDPAGRFISSVAPRG